MRDVGAEARAATWEPRRLLRASPVAVPALLVFGLVLVATRLGIGLGGDSGTYISAGTNLAHGHGLRDFSGAPLTTWPPGLPAVVAFGELLGVSGMGFVRYVNAIAFAATLILAIVLLRRHVRAPALVVVGAVFVGAGDALVGRAEEVMSEAPFIPLTLLCIVLLEDLIESARPRLALFAAAVVSVWLAFAFRYFGAILIPVGAVALLGARRWHRRSRALWALAFAAAAAAAPLAWAVRNSVVAGAAFGGSRGPSGLTVSSFVAKTTLVVGQWLAPWSPSANFQRAVAVVVFALAVAIVYLRRPVTSAVGRAGAVSLVPIGAFAAFYALAFTVVQLRTGIEWPDDRILSPIYVPLTVLTLASVDGLLARWRNAILRTVVAAALATVVVTQLVELASHAHRDAIVGLPSRAVATGVPVIANSPTLAARVRRLPPSALVYSNNPQEVWGAANRPFVLIPPVRGRTSTGDELRAFAAAAACHETYFVWVRNEIDRYAPPSELAHVTRLRPMLSVADATRPSGVLYRVRARAPCQGPG